MRFFYSLLLLAIAPVCATLRAAESFTITNAQQPQLAVAANGNVHVVFGRENSVFVASSTNSGRTYSEPQIVTTLPKLALGRRRGPRIAANNGAMVVSAISAKDGDLIAWHSSDGKTWSPDIRVNDTPKAAREGLHAMAGDGNTTLFSAWLDLRNNETELWGSVTRDNGITWEKNVLIYKSPAGHICECCHPSVAFMGARDIAVMWRNYLRGARDMYVATSHDGGRTFGAAQKLGEGVWPLNACPMDGGAIASLPSREFVSVWRRESSIYTTRGADPEKFIGVGSQPVVTAIGDKPVFVWHQENGLAMKRGFEAKPELLANEGAYPAIAPIKADGAAIVAWELNDGKNTSVVLRRVE